MITLSTVAAVIRSANVLQTSTVERAACTYFAANLEPETAVEGLIFTTSFEACGEELRALKDRCMPFIAHNFSICTTQAAFVHVRYETVLELLASDEITADEQVVLNAASAWVEADIAKRKSLVPKLLQLVRFPFLSAQAQLGLRDEKLFEYLPTKDALVFMAECSVEFANSPQAANCPRLVARLGSSMKNRQGSRFGQHTYGRLEDANAVQQAVYSAIGQLNSTCKRATGCSLMDIERVLKSQFGAKQIKEATDWLVSKDYISRFGGIHCWCE